jgi:hypothetical protein
MIVSTRRVNLQKLFLLGFYFQGMLRSICLDCTVEGQSNTKIKSFGYGSCLETSHQSTRAIPTSVLIHL